MNLINNETGSWDQSKNFLKSDLDTIQRTINQLQAQVNAIPAVTPTPPAVIASSNKVTAIDGGIIVSQTGALDGDGTTPRPLAIRVDGTSISVNGTNQLTASGGGTVHVDAAGALSGDGSVGLPLAVLVDGTSITINGSNKLASSATATLFSASATFNATQINAMGGGAPIQIIAGISSKIIWPVIVRSTVSHISGFAFTTSSTLGYTSTASNPALTGSFPMALSSGTGLGTYTGLALGLSVSSVITTDPNYPVGAGVFVRGGGANGGGGGDTTTVEVWYLIFS